MNIEIANRLVQLRREQGLSQEELASKLGVSRQAVSKWERDLSCPDVSSLPRLAEILEVSIDELMQTKPKNSSDDKKEKIRGNNYGRNRSYRFRKLGNGPGAGTE